MEILVIDDNAQFADELGKQLFLTNKQKCQSISITSIGVNQITASARNDIDKPSAALEANETSQLLEKITGSLQSDSILFININLILKKEKRLSFKGIEILTWLRIKEVKNHCILYSFQSLDTIVKNNKRNVILFSKGVTFIHLPSNFSTVDLNIIKNDFVEKENLKLYLKASFNTSEFRHRDANWWGVKALWDVHKVASEGKFNDDYPDHIKKNLFELNNAVGAYLHGLEVKDVNSFVQETFENWQALINELKKELLITIEHSQSLETEQYNWVTYTAELQRDYEDFQQAQLYVRDDLYNKFTEDIRKLLSDINQANEESRALAAKLGDSLGTIENLKKEIGESERILATFYSEVRNQLFGSNSLSPSNQCNILIIDDNSLNGWEAIFKVMLPNAKVTSSVFNPKYKNQIDELYNAVIKNDIKAINDDRLPPLILLDLRLFDEIERSIDTENVSGKILLKKIKEDFKGIPILITTASNKIWTFQKLISLGADAYWVKEGLDELRDASDSVRNYCRLMFLVDKMTDGHYKALKEFSDYTEKFERNKANHWAKEVEWINGEKIAGKLDNISKALNDSFYVLKTYLHNYHLKYGFDDNLNEAFVLSGLINKIAGVYELLHGLDKNNYKNVSHLRDTRGDLNLDKLKDLRNPFSHASYEHATWDKLTESIDEVKEYLDKEFRHESTRKILEAAFLHNNEITIIFTDKTSLQLSFKKERVSPQYNNRTVDCTNTLSGSELLVYKISGDDKKLLLNHTDLNYVVNSVLSSYGKTITVKFDSETEYKNNQLIIKHNNASGEKIIFSPSNLYRFNEYFEKLKNRKYECRVIKKADGSVDFFRDDYIKIIGDLECSYSEEELAGSKETNFS